LRPSLGFLYERIRHLQARLVKARDHRIITSAETRTGELPDVGIPIDGAWAVLKRKILSHLSSGTAILLRDSTDHRRFVQVERVHDGFHAETPSTQFIEGVTEEIALTSSDERTLVNAGWEPPFRDVLQYNWWINLPETSYETLASMVFIALRQVQKVESTTSWQFVNIHVQRVLGSVDCAV
jgi:hypothetical protein